MNLIEIENVTKRFPEKLGEERIVLDEVKLTVCSGDFVVLRGANGAGKSTLLKLILGLIKPDNGSVKLFGLPPTCPQSKLKVGAIFQEVTPPNSLTLKELINLVRSYYPNPVSTEEILENFGLTAKQDDFPSDLSGGQKQKLYFALALVGKPELLILDEPTKGLDSEAQEVFWREIERCREKKVTILMVTHVQSDQDKLESLATDIITVGEGNLTYDKQQKGGVKRIPNAGAGTGSQVVNPLTILAHQTWAELLQLIRPPSYLIGLIIFSFLSVVVIMIGNFADSKFILVSLCAIIFLILGVDRLSKRVALERMEGWLKLLRVTPLPPSLYIGAKVMIMMGVLTLSLITILMTAFGTHIVEPGLEWLGVSAALLGVMVPFIAMGIALGYAVNPKSVDSIAGLLFPIGAFFAGLIPIQNSWWVEDIIVLSPFFHYRKMVEIIAEIGPGIQIDKSNLTLHLLWLIFYGLLAGAIAVFAYQRDRFAQ
ncbi:MAG: ATP-binding cassette domain-containing protein [Planktothrix sp.]